MRDLLEVTSVICLQAIDEHGNAIPVPRQFLMARLGPFVIASSPRLVPRPRLLSTVRLSLPARSHVHAPTRSKVTLTAAGRVAAFTATLGMLGTGFVLQTVQGTSFLIAGSFLALGSCLFELNNQAALEQI